MTDTIDARPLLSEEEAEKLSVTADPDMLGDTIAERFLDQAIARRVGA
jgi:hypothetical protein